MKNYMKHYRSSYGYDQYSFADKMGCSQTIVGLIEVGKRKPTPDFMAKAAKILNTTPEILFPGEFSFGKSMTIVVFTALEKFMSEVTQSKGNDEKLQAARQEFTKVLCQSNPLISASTTSIQPQEVQK